MLTKEMAGACNFAQDSETDRPSNVRFAGERTPLLRVGNRGDETFDVENAPRRLLTPAAEAMIAIL